MAESAVTVRECGYCLQKDHNLVEPKVLPCSHVHCLQCLTAYFNVHHVVRCPKCREVFDTTLDSLPVASLVGDDTPLCDVCTEDGVKDQPAVTYCTSCCKKYCTKHKEYHDALFKTHPKIPMSEFRDRARQLEVRTCTEHGQQLIMGCKSCLIIVCVRCRSTVKSCTDGAAHDMMSLEELVETLTGEVDESKAEVPEREEKLEKLFKKTSERVADYEAETGEMVERIHQRRDEQMKAIHEKYQNLERELVEMRAQSKSAMMRFMEEDVGRRLSDLSTNRINMEAKIKHSHQVDIVTEYRDIKGDMQKLLDEVLPVLLLEKTYELDSTEESRDIELKMVSAGDKTLPPTSLKLIHTVKLPSYPHSVCHHQGITFTGLQNGSLSRVGDNSQLVESFLTFDNRVSSVTVYNEKIYTLIRGSPSIVYVHDLSDQFINKWNHPDINLSFNKMTIIADEVIIPDRLNNRLTCYSLTGQVLRHLSCPLLSDSFNSYVAVCAADSDSLIVSDHQSNQVFRMKISTGEVLWTSTHVTKPEGVVCHGGSCTLVASQGSDKIRILDVHSGEFLSEVTAEGFPSGSHMFDLRIFGRTLITPDYIGKALRFYEM